MILACKRLIDSFAGSLAREYPGLDSDDIRSEAWLCALEVKGYWLPGAGAVFTSYLFQRLIWLRSKIIRSYYLRLENETEYFRLKPEHTILDLSLDTLCWAAMQDASEIERSVFALMVDPPPDFIRFVQRADHGSSPCSRRRSKGTICHFHYARYLGVSEDQVAWASRKIGKAIREVL